MLTSDSKSIALSAELRAHRFRWLIIAEWRDEIFRISAFTSKACEEYVAEVGRLTVNNG